MFDKIADFLSRDFEMAEVVYNKEKKISQVVLSKIPFNKRTGFGMPKCKKSYICSELDKPTWTVELGSNLRPATIFERHV